MKNLLHIDTFEDGHLSVDTSITGELEISITVGDQRSCIRFSASETGVEETKQLVRAIEVWRARTISELPFEVEFSL